MASQTFGARDPALSGMIFVAEEQAPRECEMPQADDSRRRRLSKEQIYNVCYYRMQLYPISMRDAGSLSYWSKNEAILPVKTDHWAKQRAKTFTRVELPNGGIITQCRPENILEARKRGMSDRRRSVPLTSSDKQSSEVTVTAVSFAPHAQTQTRPKSSPVNPSQSTFQDLVRHELGRPSCLPQVRTQQAHSHRRAMSAPSRSAILRTSYNTRAREGFQYWHEDKPKKTQYGAKYTLGAKNTVIGLGQTAVV